MSIVSPSTVSAARKIYKAVKRAREINRTYGRSVRRTYSDRSYYISRTARVRSWYGALLDEIGDGTIDAIRNLWQISKQDEDAFRSEFISVVNEEYEKMQSLAGNPGQEVIINEYAVNGVGDYVDHIIEICDTVGPKAAAGEASNEYVWVSFIENACEGSPKADAISEMTYDAGISIASWASEWDHHFMSAQLTSMLWLNAVARKRSMQAAGTWKTPNYLSYIPRGGYPTDGSSGWYSAVRVWSSPAQQNYYKKVSENYNLTPDQRASNVKNTWWYKQAAGKR